MELTKTASKNNNCKWTELAYLNTLSGLPAKLNGILDKTNNRREFGLLLTIKA